MLRMEAASSEMMTSPGARNILPWTIFCGNIVSRSEGFIPATEK